MTLTDAQRKARYGHSDWLYWKGQAAKKSPEAMKRCLLECGTKGDWLLVSANDGTLVRGFWWLGLNLLAHMRRGGY